jgi:hypothetical protein
MKIDVKKWTFIGILFLFFTLGTFMGWHAHPNCSVIESIEGVVPLETVAGGMTEEKPDTIYVPVPVPVPGPERIVYSTETQAVEPEVIPIETVEPGPERDAAVSAALIDWNTKRSYKGTLFDDPRAGTVSYSFDVQFNRAGHIDYRFTPVSPPAPKAKRFGIGIQAGYGLTGDRLAPYIGVGVQYNLFTF